MLLDFAFWVLVACFIYEAGKTSLASLYVLYERVKKKHIRG